MTPDTAIADYVVALEAMRPETIDQVLALCAGDVHFTDPFNDVTGTPALRTVFEDMFETVSDLEFRVSDCYGAGRTWLLRWTYSGRMGRLGPMTIAGMSYIGLDAGNLVCRHADYWDSGDVFARIPVFGAAIRGLRRRISAGKS